MANPRIGKLSEQIQFVVAEMLAHKVKDPRLGFVTVTDVRLTPDAREASVFYTVLGNEEDLANSAEALESAKGLLRSTVGKRLGLKFAPTLSFVLDASYEAARDMDDLLARVQLEDQAKAEQAKGAQYAGDANPYIDSPDLESFGDLDSDE